MTSEPIDTQIQTSGIHASVSFSLKPDAKDKAVLAEELGIVGIKKLSFVGKIEPRGASDLNLTGNLGATVVQECVVSGVPVATRIDEPIVRHYLADLPIPEETEAEMPEDENAEPLPTYLDLREIMAEALALALPPWPRAEGLEPLNVSVTEPGKTPMTDDDAKPFAGLKTLTNIARGKEDKSR